jgi:selT/selW/selH-like putative selenoprotein
VAEIEQTTDVSAKATPGETSQFDVLADGQLIFSKQAEGRFPEHDEILAQLG